MREPLRLAARGSFCQQLAASWLSVRPIGLPRAGRGTTSNWLPAGRTRVALAVAALSTQPMGVMVAARVDGPARQKPGLRACP
jgi:hypothetical protein